MYDILPSLAVLQVQGIIRLATISHSEFNSSLDALGSSPGAIPYDTQDGGSLGPSDSLPPATNPSSRRPARPLPRRPDPLGFLGAFRDAICGVYALAPATTCRNLQRTPGPPLPGENFDSGLNSRCHGNLQRFCGGAPPSLQPPLPDAPPIAGGQCDGIVYDVSVRTSRFGSNCARVSDGTGTTRVWGPVSDVRLSDNPNGSPSSRPQLLEIFCRGKSSDPIGPAQWVNAGGRTNLAPNCPFGVIESVAAARVDGQLDNCGNAPPRYRYDRNYPPVIDIDIDVGVGAPVNISPSVSIGGPTLSIGLPSIGPISVDIGGITINPPPSPPDGPTPSPTPPPRPAPDTTVTDPDDPPPPPPLDEPAVEEPVERGTLIIRGVLVTVSSTEGGNSSVIFQSGNPDVYVPDMGLVSFRCAANDSASGWTQDIRVKNLRQIIECPWTGGAFDVRGTPRPGYSFQLTPIIETIPVEPEI